MGNFFIFFFIYRLRRRSTVFDLKNDFTLRGAKYTKRVTYGKLPAGEEGILVYEIKFNARPI